MESCLLRLNTLLRLNDLFGGHLKNDIIRLSLLFEDTNEHNTVKSDIWNFFDGEFKEFV